MKPNFFSHEDWPRGLLRWLRPGCFPVRSDALYYIVFKHIHIDDIKHTR